MGVETLFFQALEIEDKNQRDRFVDEAEVSEEVRIQTRKLLDAHENPDGDLSRPFGLPATVDSSPIAEGPGTRIGPYKLLQQIGEGGFGLVFMAERVESIQQKVAVKIVKPGMDSKNIIARFETERQALALMDHPNIARVLDAGATETGRPYFVMELVKGLPITEYCTKAQLSTVDRLALFSQVCSAVQHAHQKGVIHRDIKPSNVLVSTLEGKPIAKVIDFGVAKAINQRLTEKTLFTAYGHMIGTPQYMSPEQAELSILDVDLRTDVYSLGVLLYEMLTGTTPVRKDRLLDAAFDEMRRLIREEEAERPSHRVSTLGEAAVEVAKSQGSQPDSLQRYMRGDLDWIILKALEKDRSRRYDSPKNMAEDIERFLATRPIEARRPSLVYRTGKMVSRNKNRILTLAAVLLVAMATWTVAALSKPAESDSVDLGTMLSRGRTYQVDGDYEASEDVLKSAQDAALAALKSEDQKKLAESLLPEISSTLMWTLLSQRKSWEAFENAEKVLELAQEHSDDIELQERLQRQSDFARGTPVIEGCVFGMDAETLDATVRLAETNESKIIRAFAALRAGRLDLADELITACDDIPRWDFYELVAAEILRQQGEIEVANCVFQLAQERLSKSSWMLNSEIGWQGFHELLHHYEEEIRPNFQLDAEDLDTVTYEKVVRRLPNYPEPMLKLGAALANDGRYDEAFESLLLATKLGAPRGIWYAGLVALKLENSQQYQTCVELAQEYLETETSEWHVTFPQCIALQALHPQCSVSPEWLDVLRRVRKQGVGHHAVFAEAMCSIRRRDWQAAHVAVSRIRSNQDAVNALNALIEVHRGKRQTAEDYYRKALDASVHDHRPPISEEWVIGNRLATEILLREVQRKLDAGNDAPVAEPASL